MKKQPRHRQTDAANHHAAEPVQHRARSEYFGSSENEGSGTTTSRLSDLFFRKIFDDLIHGHFNGQREDEETFAENVLGGSSSLGISGLVKMIESWGGVCGLDGYLAISHNANSAHEKTEALMARICVGP